jgi:hypothetical protein
VPVLDSLDCLLAAAAAAAARPMAAPGHPPTPSAGLAGPLAALMGQGLGAA